MLATAAFALTLSAIPGLPLQAADEVPPTIVVSADNTEIDRSCILRFEGPIADADGNGVVHIIADDITVSFAEDAHLTGRMDASTRPDALTGIGVRIEASGVTIENARISGYKVGMLAAGADRLTIAVARIDDIYRQELLSTSSREVTSDWLFPHHNDQGEWARQHGAAICVRDAEDVTIHDVVVRDSQNGILIERVNESAIFDCDCSFLSGWGLGMWRSNRNMISRNAFDFCIRGYSHGIYNRGQDSAGILMFEQCSRNAFLENSATHGGDGFFGFSGKEALGEVNPNPDPEWYRDRGHVQNFFIGNDFSYAAAHGLELTFAFDNIIARNVFTENAICGIWGGYSDELYILGNQFKRNGDMGYGAERGAINIEHGSRNVIATNLFEGNACGVHLWWDDDGRLLETPWAQVNGAESDANFIHRNRFEEDRIAIQLRGSTNVGMSMNVINDAEIDVDVDEASTFNDETSGPMGVTNALEARGSRRPVGARAHLKGRDKILMMRWGPFDWEGKMTQAIGPEVDASGHPMLTIRTYGRVKAGVIQSTEKTSLEQFDLVTHHHPGHGIVTDRILTMRTPGIRSLPSLEELGLDPADPTHADVALPDYLVWMDWELRHFTSPCDPRDDVERWRQGASDVEPVQTPFIDFVYGGGGPTTHNVGGNHFGTIATTVAKVPRGRWTITTRSDDGIRVWVNGELLIDDWTWHAPKDHRASFEVDDFEDEVEIRVEHFELDGHAELRVNIEPEEK